MAKSKIWAIPALVLLMVLAVAGFVNAAVGTPLSVSINEVSLNGDELTADEVTRTSVERDGTLDLKVQLQSQINTTLENVEITAFIVGYEYNDNRDEQLSATTAPFDVDSDVVYTKSLKIQLPTLIDTNDYKLRIIVADRYGAAQIYNYNFKIEAPRHNIEIRDVVFSPDSEVVAGRALLSVVRIKNLGEKDEQGIKVKVAIPDLSVSASQYIDELVADKSVSSEELYLRIPACAEAGLYDVETTVTFDEGHGVQTKHSTIEVTSDSACKAAKPTAPAGTDGTPAPLADKVVVTIAPVTQTVTRGEGGAIYQVTLSNEGSNAKTYTLTVDGADAWAITRVSPSGIVSLNAGEQKTVYVYVTAKENAAAGTHLFTVNLNADGKTLKQLSASAEIAEPTVTDSAMKNALELGAIVLLVLLVIVALVVGFNKMRGNKEATDVTQTYY